MGSGCGDELVTGLQKSKQKNKYYLGKPTIVLKRKNSPSVLFSSRQHLRHQNGVDVEYGFIQNRDLVVLGGQGQKEHAVCVCTCVQMYVHTYSCPGSFGRELVKKTLNPYLPMSNDKTEKSRWNKIQKCLSFGTLAVQNQRNG